MNDLIERLNDPLECPDTKSVFDLCREAADEIERLRADLALLQVAAKRADNIEKHRDELYAELAALETKTPALINK